MLKPLMANLATVLPYAAPPEPAGSGINSQAIVAWVLGNIVPLIVMGLGVLIIMGARKADYSKTLNTVGIIVIGLVVIGGVVALRAFANDMSSLVFG